VTVSTNLVVVVVVVLDRPRVLAMSVELEVKFGRSTVMPLFTGLYLRVAVSRKKMFPA
jgi:hypothetical protein